MAENQEKNKLTEDERKSYCLFCIYHERESYDDNEGCITHSGTINFDSLKKNGHCRYKLTKENARKEIERREKSIDSLIPVVDKIFDDIELSGGHIEYNNNTQAYAVRLIKHISSKYL